jgi:hypothetical protein
MLSKNCARAGPSAPGCKLETSALIVTTFAACMTTAIIRSANPARTERRRVDESGSSVRRDFRISTGPVAFKKPLKGQAGL